MVVVFGSSKQNTTIDSYFELRSQFCYILIAVRRIEEKVLIRCLRRNKDLFIEATQKMLDFGSKWLIFRARGNAYAKESFDIGSLFMKFAVTRCFSENHE